MNSSVNQLIGIVAKVSLSNGVTVIDYSGPVQVYDGNWSTAQDVKFVLDPGADATAMVLLAASIGRRLELAGAFTRDEPLTATVRASAVVNIIVG